ncbi:MAG: helix-turn-helix transcriptional regulator [Cytophagales bacterium]|nr:helix-turn-helix transcriptional regulator [Cytophaga sp.]
MNDKIYIKNMVCPRCVESVTGIFKELNIPVEEVRLGEVLVSNAIGKHDFIQLKSALETKGFEILEDKKTQLVEKVKTLVIDLVYQDASPHLKLSSYLTEHIPYDYSYISNSFTAHEGITIEKFVILQKTERVKELLTYHELTLSEIAYKLHYSSTAALSAQFKDNTGMTPTEFKRSADPGRKNIDHLIS